MNKNAIRGVLFSLVSAVTISAHSQEKLETIPKLTLIEELPIERRVIVQDHVIKFLKQNPKSMAPNSILAIDDKGNIYVIDKDLAQISNLGQPSCPGAGI